MKILNPWNSWDFHLHTLNYSDWFNTIDEMVVQAGKIWLKKIAFTDHSSKLVTSIGIWESTVRSNFEHMKKRWKNIHNDVEVMLYAIYYILK